jgi:histidinol phosphatase-like PHP family hydrolase
MSDPFRCDGHVHTIYSGHSGPEMFIPAVMARAAELGLARVVILEHVPTLDAESYLQPHRWFAGRNDRAAVAALVAEVGPRRVLYPGTEFLVGVEVDADPVRLDGSLMLTNLAGVDVVLAATHLLPGGGDFWFDRPQIPEEERPAMRARWLAWLQRVVARPEVDVLAHPACELAACRLADGFGPEFRRAFEPVALAMARNRVAFELNEAAINRLSVEEAAGYVELVRLVRECGARFAPGSDAHRGHHLGMLDTVRLVAEAAGLEAADFWAPAAE